MNESRPMKTIFKSEQILADLTRRIQSGEFGPKGEKIPSERDLGKQYGCSQVTMNKITAMIVTQGILTRRQGSGTYVAVHPKK
ncbi:MAG: GntR family transcriptional regulator [Planctomycetota bacterium]